MNETCGCCEGISGLTPLSTANRPGLPALVYRVGTYSSFFQSMRARLSSLRLDLPADGMSEADPQRVLLDPLHNLTTRDASDPALALLDAWAIVAHVLTFYQERIANEGYLRTATERRSVQELAQLVDYMLRPGVASSVYLAYTIQQDNIVLVQGGAGAPLGGIENVQRERIVTIPHGSRAQSVPGPGETTQTFETMDTIEARSTWNNLQPRLTQPQWISPQNPTPLSELRFKGQATNLRPNDPLLFVFGDGLMQQFPGFVADVTLEPEADRTKVSLQTPPWPVQTTTSGVNGNAPRSTLLAPARLRVSGSDDGDGVRPFGFLSEALGQLELAPSVPPPNASRLPRSLNETYAQQADVAPRLLLAMNPRLESVLYPALHNAAVTAPTSLQSVQALRVKAAPFGNNAPLKPITDRIGRVVDHMEWPLTDTVQVEIQIPAPSSESALRSASGAPIAMVAETTAGQTAQISIIQSGVTNSQNVPIVSGSASPPSVMIGEVRVDITINQLDPLNVAFTFNFAQPRRISLFVNKSRDNELAATIQGAVLHIPSDQSLRDKSRGVLTAIDYAANPNGQPQIHLTSELPSTTVNPLVVALDAQYDTIVHDDWVVIERSDIEQSTRSFYQVDKTRIVTRAAYGIVGKVTELTLKPSQADPWLKATDRSLNVYRNTTIYTQGVPLTLAPEPLTDRAENGSPGRIRGDEIELGDLYAGLDAGRWLVVSGERADISDTDGVMASELVMLAGVRQDVQKVALASPPPSSTNGTSVSPPMIDRPDDKIHTFLRFARPLNYTYKLPTVTINGNVVRATHGETRNETLGSGDSSKAMQSFGLHQTPLTYLPAPTAAGAASTLEVRVNDLVWHKTDNLVEQTPTDRAYITQTGDDGKTAVVFGNGEHGARPPSGPENIKARYRSGIGKAGNVNAEQITLLTTKPLGVQSVINPLPATGGADRETSDQARRNTPLAVMALDRLLSIQDYADFARTFAGIGKANAQRLSDGRRQLVHLTVAGAENIPIDDGSDLLLNLRLALQKQGDPYQVVQVAACVVDLLVMKAQIRLQADYLWEAMATTIRKKLLEHFGFEQRELGQSVFLSEVLGVLQAIRGVDYVQMEIMDTLNEQAIQTMLQQPQSLADALQLHEHIAVPLAAPAVGTDQIEPAHIAILSPDVPDTLLLTELKDG